MHGARIARDEENAWITGKSDCLVTWSSKKILVLQRTDTLRRAMIHVLGGFGYLPLEAATTEEAIEHFRRGTKVDALVCDIVTQDESGPELVRRFRKYGPLKAIFVSPPSSGLRRGATVVEPRAYVLTVPFGTSEFLAALHETFGCYFD